MGVSYDTFFMYGILVKPPKDEGEFDEWAWKVREDDENPLYIEWSGECEEETYIVGMRESFRRIYLDGSVGTEYGSFDGFTDVETLYTQEQRSIWFIKLAMLVGKESGFNECEFVDVEPKVYLGACYS